jgi:hypothetical protein
MPTRAGIEIAPRRETKAEIPQGLAIDSLRKRRETVHETPPIATAATRETRAAMRPPTVAIAIPAATRTAAPTVAAAVTG